MTLDELRALKGRLAELCREYGIAELEVFGSVACDSAGPDSDVDLLYVRAPGNDLGMDYFALQEDLEVLFGCPVDLVPKNGLHKAIRERVLADAQVLMRREALDVAGLVENVRAVWASRSRRLREVFSSRSCSPVALYLHRAPSTPAGDNADCKIATNGAQATKYAPHHHRMGAWLRSVRRRCGPLVAILQPAPHMASEEGTWLSVQDTGLQDRDEKPFPRHDHRL